MPYEQAFAITKRLDSLLGLVERGLYCSRSLAEKLGVSEQTVYRDILFLRKQGHPIQSVKLSANWAYRLSVSEQSNRQRQAGRRK